MKEVTFSQEARSKLLDGVNLVAKAVTSTLGPKGRNSILSRDTAPPIVTNDGVTIAQQFNKVKDPYVNTGVQMIKEVATKQNEPGDGTTTATLLASTLVNEGAKYLLAGIDPIEIKEGLLKSSTETIDKLKKLSVPVDTKEKLIEVATVSVEDKETGKLIGEIVHDVGKDGAVTVETSKDVKLEKDTTNGLKFNQGWITPYLMTNPFRQEAVYEDVPILVTDHTFSINEEIVPIMEGLASKGIKSLVVICDDMKAEPLTTVVNNTLGNHFHVLVVKLPGMDEQRTLVGEDIAIACGAKFISNSLDKLEDVKLEDLGEVKKIISKQEYTVIVEGAGEKKQVEDRIKVLKEEIKNAISDFDRDQLKERIARLSGGIGVVRIGAATEQELTYKKMKIEDALAATRAAMEEGIVPGGGVALLRLSKESDSIGEKIFYESIKSPIKKIAENAGKNPDTIVEKILDGNDPNFGWNAKTDSYLDLMKSGIIDPVKVTRKAIENAVSMASMFLTTESLIVDFPEEQKDNKPMGAR